MDEESKVALVTPIHSSPEEGEGAVKSWPARINGYTVVASLAAICFSATTVTLAVMFPVTKHKFTRFNCVSHEKIEALVAEVVPLVADYGCEREQAMCSEARRVTGFDLLRSCTKAECAEASKKAGSGSVLDWAVRHDDFLGHVEVALCSHLNISRSWCNATSACIASAECQAAKEFWADPQLFCGESLSKHADTCVAARSLIKSAEAEAVKYCADHSDNGKVAFACTFLNTSLHDRGHYEEVCEKAGVLKRKLCVSAVQEAKTAIMDKVCGVGGQNEKVCDAIFAVAKRWANESAPLPLLEVGLKAADTYCANGFCSAKDGLAPLERIKKGSLALELDTLSASLPSICGSWPIVQDACANATARLVSFCKSHGLACQWLGQVANFNATEAESLFVETYEAAEALCNDDTMRELDLQIPFFTHRRQHLRLSTATEDACSVQKTVDKTAAQCPDMLPLISVASGKDKK